MPEGAWRAPAAYITLGLIWMVVFGYLVWGLATDQAEIRLKGEDTAQAHIQYAEDQIAQECASLEGDAFRDCVYEQIASAEDHGRARQDLEAQQEMALFTRIMGYTALAGILIGLVSIPLIFLTLRATQDMAVDQRRIGEAQVRAYLSVDQARCCSIPPSPETMSGRDYVAVSFRVRNFGQSPARNIHFVVEFLGLKPRGDGRERATIYSGTLELREMPAGGKQRFGPVHLGINDVPADIERGQDGAINVSGAHIGLFAADVFGCELFASALAERVTIEALEQPYVLPKFDLCATPLGPLDTLRSKGWAWSKLTDRRPKRQAE